MRLPVGIAAVVVTLLLGAGAASAAPRADDYKGFSTPGDHMVLFSTVFLGGDLTVIRFSRDLHELFAGTPLHHDPATGIWSFHTHDAHWRVKGHWVNADEVHGSICDLVKSPSGCPGGEHLQTYVAHSKTSIKLG
jgi:hypothetical protein